MAGEEWPTNPHAIMGFTGKNLEAAEFLLADAQVDQDATRAARDRDLGLAIFESFVRLPMNPPRGEGFDIKTGQPELAIPRDHRVYLRSFGDDMKATLRATVERNSTEIFILIGSRGLVNLETGS